MRMAWIDTTNDYWLPTSLSKMRDALLEVEHETLVELIINNRYNDFVRERADFRDGETPVTPGDGNIGGKRVPYIGWFWRSTNFYRKRIPIGDCGDFIRVMENNKWDYRERMLTEDECDQVIAVIDAAMTASHQGGELRIIQQNTYRELERLWPLFQSFADSDAAWAEYDD